MVLAVSGAFLASRILPYVGARFTNWLDAFNPERMDNESYQLVNGLFGMAHGGLIGTGLGQAIGRGRQAIGHSPSMRTTRSSTDSPDVASKTIG